MNPESGECVRTIDGLHELLAAKGEEFGVTEWTAIGFTPIPSVRHRRLKKVRLSVPLPVGSRVRMHCQLADVDTSRGAPRISLRQTFERDGSEKPVCVATHVVPVLG